MVTFIGFNLTFFPQFILGYLGMPRRYHAYPPEFQVLNVFSTAGATVLGVGYLLPMLYLTWSLKYGAIAGDNPWQATGLEWQTQSPPLTENFLETPIVDYEAYDYEWLAHKKQARGEPVSDSQAIATARRIREHVTSIRLPAPPLRDRGAAARSHELRHVALPADRNHVLRRPLLRLPDLSQLVLPGLRRGQHQLSITLGHRQHSSAHHLRLRHGDGRLVRGDANAGRGW